MKKIKVGFLPLYIKLYDDSQGLGYRIPMEKYMKFSMLYDERVRLSAPFSSYI